MIIVREDRFSGIFVKEECVLIYVIMKSYFIFFILFEFWVDEL